MAGGRKKPGYAGRKFFGKRHLNERTPGMPRKGEAWPGSLTPPGYSVQAQRTQQGVRWVFVKND